MLCQKCSKRQATTHIKRVINGEATESHLCSDCASALGYDGFFGGFNFSIPNIFSSFFTDGLISLGSAKTERCEKCQSSFDDIVKSGMVGCSDCYEKFYDKLLPSLQRIHGKTRHEGKNPTIIKAEVTNVNPIEDLEEQLRIAIDEQNFEKAAQLRDKINELKEGQK
jgi:protein arginine kinase activator